MLQNDQMLWAIVNARSLLVSLRKSPFLKTQLSQWDHPGSQSISDSSKSISATIEITKSAQIQSLELIKYPSSQSTVSMRKTSSSREKSMTSFSLTSKLWPESDPQMLSFQTSIDLQQTVLKIAQQTQPELDAKWNAHPSCPSYKTKIVIWESSKHRD